jgi:hypothetical protein
MRAIRYTEGTANTEPSLGEVEGIAVLSTNPVSLLPHDVLSVHASLQDKVLQQQSHMVVTDCCDDGCTLIEHATKPTHDVVLAATFPDSETPCHLDSLFARVQTQHHFSQRDCVIPAFIHRTDFK